MVRLRLFARCSTSGRLVSRPGVVASVVTAAPDRSMFNWVVYERFDAMLEHYAAIVRVYQHAGVRAWTVWVDSGDAAAAARALSERGHKLDSQPIAMAAEIAGLILAATGDLDWSETRDAGLVARINGFAYGFPPPAFEECSITARYLVAGLHRAPQRHGGGCPARKGSGERRLRNFRGRDLTGGARSRDRDAAVGGGVARGAGARRTHHCVASESLRRQGLYRAWMPQLWRHGDVGKAKCRVNRAPGRV